MLCFIIKMICYIDDNIMRLLSFCFYVIGYSDKISIEL